MEAAIAHESQPQPYAGPRAFRQFQEFVDTYPDIKKRPLRLLPTDSDVRWLEDSRRAHRIALRPEDWLRLPSDGLLLGVRWTGKVYVIGVRDERVTAAVLAIGALGSDSIPWA